MLAFYSLRITITAVQDFCWVDCTSTRPRLRKQLRNTKSSRTVIKALNIYLFSHIEYARCRNDCPETKLLATRCVIGGFTALCRRKYIFSRNVHVFSSLMGLSIIGESIEIIRNRVFDHIRAFGLGSSKVSGANSSGSLSKSRTAHATGSEFTIQQSPLQLTLRDLGIRRCFLTTEIWSPLPSSVAVVFPPRKESVPHDNSLSSR